MFILEVFALSIEKNLLISLLKLTKEQRVLIKDVKNDSGLPFDTTRILLEKLQNDGTIYLEGENIKIDSQNRLKLAVKAATLGADVERVSSHLSWQEFENIAAVALENNNFTIAKNVHFKNSGHRWEIDVVGCKKPLVVCIDCKHWQRGMSPSVLSRIVDAQAERTKALAEACSETSIKIEYKKWTNAKFMPAVLSLIPCSFKFYNNVPIVPILQLQDFISQLPAYTDKLKFFARTFEHLDNNF